MENLRNQARDAAALAIKRRIKHRIINNLSNNTVACKIQTKIGTLIIGKAYIPPRRPIVPRADFDILKTHNCPVYVLGDFNGNHRQLGDRQTNDAGEQLAELMKIGGLNYMGPDFKTFHNHQGSRTSNKVMGYQSNILN